MKKLTFPLFLIFLLVFASCENEYVQPNTNLKPKPITVSTKTAQLIQNNNQFGLELFKNVASQIKGDTNVMLSPLSATLALSMTYNGAAGTTKTAFENTLGFSGQTTSDINQSLENLSNALTSVDPKVTFNLANSIWYSNTFSVEQSFLNTDEQYYNAKVSALDFNDPSSVNTINNWVSKKTNGKIPTIIKSINPSELMILINATYFKGNWKYQFDPSKTENKTFYLQDGSAEQVPTMTQKIAMGYTNTGTFQAVELPYGRGNFSMILILPNKDKSLGDIENEMTEVNWQQWTSQLDSFELTINLPKFKFSYSKTLNKVLSDLGLGVAFSPGAADFSNINPSADLYISKVLQKTYINVDEEGTEAAAVTVVGIDGVSAYTPTSISFNRPFLFVIKEKYTNAILFIGCVRDPSKN